MHLNIYVAWKQQLSRHGEHRSEQDQTRKRILLSELKVCRNLQRGKDIHAEVIASANCSCIYLTTALVNMYCKCGSMIDARLVFDSLKHQDVVSWTALILGYAENGESRTALDLFAAMRSRGCTPNSFSFIAALKACTFLAVNQTESGRVLELGKQIHSQVGGCHLNMYVQNILVNMYAKCGSMVHARQVFDCIKQPTLVSWNSLILGYAENGEGITALDLFERMKIQGCARSSVSFIAAIKSCTSLAVVQNETRKAEYLERGKQIHSEVDSYLNMHIQTTLIHMYASFGSMVHARQVFDCINCPDVVTWTALILGYAENGEGITALDLFARMKNEGCAPNTVTYVAALKACGFLGALECGIEIHAEIGTGIECDTILVTCLVDFYAKCGSLVEAQKVFDLHSRKRDLKTWTALLTGYSCLGDAKAVFGLFKRMQDASVKPDGITFLCILTCCNHAGLIEMASDYFEAMSSQYGVSPTVEHYNCMLDIFGRSNRLDDAIVLLESMPCRPNQVTWMTILDACDKCKNVEIGKRAFNSLVNLDDTNAAAYVMASHVHICESSAHARQSFDR